MEICSPPSSICCCCISKYFYRPPFLQKALQTTYNIGIGYCCGIGISRYVGHSSACSSLGWGRLVIVVKTELPKRPFGCLLCETNHASLTNQCLTAPAMCTVPDPSPRPSVLHHFSSLRASHGNQVTSIHTHTISRTEFSIMSGVARHEALRPRYSYRNCILMNDMISPDDSPRRKIKVLQAIKSWPPCIVN